MTSKEEKFRIITPKFRVSYPHLFKPHAMNEASPKFAITMLLPKTADLTQLREALKKAKIAEWGPKANWPQDLESPVSDGDSPKYADKEGYKGCWIVKATSHKDRRPTVVDENVNAIIDEAQFYPGCYAIAQIFARPWKFGKKQGIQFIVDHVQKVGDGKPFSSRQPVEQVFKPVQSAGIEDDEAETDDEDNF